MLGRITILHYRPQCWGRYSIYGHIHNAMVMLAGQLILMHYSWASYQQITSTSILSLLTNRLENFLQSIINWRRSFVENKFFHVSSPIWYLTKSLKTLKHKHIAWFVVEVNLVRKIYTECRILTHDLLLASQMLYQPS